MAGAAYLPSDFASRNTPECDDPVCQVCSFTWSSLDSGVCKFTADEVMRGCAKLPFMKRSTWLGLQADCPDIRQTRALLQQGTRPLKKLTNICDVKRYLSVATLAKDGLLVVRRHTPLAASTECIVVPAVQLKALVKRYFYALDMDALVQIT